MSQTYRCRWPIQLGAALACATLVAHAGYGATPPESGSAAPGIWVGNHIKPGGHRPPGAVLQNPYNGSAKNAKSGEQLFTAMHCDGCHAAEGAGSVGPSLADGRWIFGGSDSAVFMSVFYGRPNGMPAFGGVLGEQGVWDIVTYLRSLSPPSDVPTESWEPKPPATQEGKPMRGQQ